MFRYQAAAAEAATAREAAAAPAGGRVTTWPPRPPPPAHSAAFKRGRTSSRRPCSLVSIAPRLNQLSDQSQTFILIQLRLKKSYIQNFHLSSTVGKHNVTTPHPTVKFRLVKRASTDTVTRNLTVLTVLHKIVYFDHKI